MVAKFLSRKLLVVILSGILDVLVAQGSIPPEVKSLVLALISSLAGVYVVVQGIVDAIKATKSS